jgi:plasmid stabilization system protein ParE
VRPLRVRERARREIDTAFAWYLQHSTTAAQRFLDAIDEAIAAIVEAPDSKPHEF